MNEREKIDLVYMQLEDEESDCRKIFVEKKGRKLLFLGQDFKVSDF